MNYLLLFNGFWYIILVAIIMVASKWAKDTSLFNPIYYWLYKTIKSKRLVVVLISMLSGVLPIQGRTIVSAGVLDTLAPKDKQRRKIFGIIDYLSTHHYYLWSPLEKTVLLPMAALSLSYFGFLEQIYPLLVTELIFIYFYIFVVLKEEDVNIKESAFLKKERKATNIWSGIKWDILVFIGIVILISNVISMYHSDLVALVKEFSISIPLAAILSFVASFILGSSSKYAGITVILTTIFGITYFPLFFAVGYFGYLISPTHKCLVTAKTFFDTDLKLMYKVLSTLGLLLIGVSLIWLF